MLFRSYNNINSCKLEKYTVRCHFSESQKYRSLIKFNFCTLPYLFFFFFFLMFLEFNCKGFDLF